MMRRYRVRLVCVLLLVISGVVGYVVYHNTVSRSFMRRGYGFLIYGNAIRHYAELSQGVLPDSLEELEQAYNAFDRRRANIPMYPGAPRPTYRPTGELRGGPYLVLVESPPERWYDCGRFVMYATAEGEVTLIDRVWGWEVDDVIAADDRLREVERARAGQSP